MGLKKKEVLGAKEITGKLTKQGDSFIMYKVRHLRSPELVSGTFWQEVDDFILSTHIINGLWDGDADFFVQGKRSVKLDIYSTKKV